MALDETAKISGQMGASDALTEHIQSISDHWPNCATERLDDFHELSLTVLELAGLGGDLHEYIKNVTRLIQKWSDCQCVGIRLKDGDDYPYFETRGFDDKFVLLENSLCQKDHDGETVYDNAGHPVLDCMCGNVIRGRFDPSLPFFSEYGSFWCNHTSEMLARTTEKERQSSTRNRCNGEGYESVVLIPLKTTDKVFGLLQINDHRKNCFTPEKLRVFERIAGELAVGLELRETAEHARESQRRYHMLIENQSDLIVELDTDQKLVFVSNEYCRIFGQTESELVGQSFAPLVHPDDVAAATAALAQLDKPPYKNTHVERDFTVDGWKWIQWSAKGVLDENGKLNSIVSVGRDVTELRHAQKQLRDSEQKYRQLFTHMYDGVAIWEAVDDGNDFILREMNKRGAIISAVNPPDVIGQRATKIFPGIKEMGLLKVFKNVWQSGQTQSHDMSLYDDGRLSRWFENKVYKLPTGQIVAVYADVSDRKRIEDALKLSQQRLELALRGADLATWDWNIADRYYDFDRNWCDMIGYDMSELDHDPEVLKNTLMHPEDMAELDRQLQLHIDGYEEFFQSEYRMKHKSGKWVWVLSRGQIIQRDSDGKPVRACGTHLDITEYKNLQNQLRQSQKMQAVGTLAGGIAHDFNNLLQVIQGYADIALASTQQGDENYEALSEVVRASDRAAQLTRQLLTFSRRDTVYPRNIFLDELLDETTAMLSRLLKENIDLTLEVKKDLPPVYMDQGQLEQVLVNLCVNAGDAMSIGGGELTIKASQQQLCEPLSENGLTVDAGHYVVLTVSDTGCGIDSETAQRVFEPFFTTKHPGHGTGLGLSTVYGIVERCGGLITLESELSAGSCFTIYLAVSNHKDPANQQPKVDSSQPLGGSETVLISEDNEMVRNLAKKILTDAGYSVISTDSGDKALQKLLLNKDTIDAAFLDVIMPGLSGPDIVTEIRQRNIHLPTVLMTGYSSQFLVSGKLPEDCQVLEKPFTPTQLLKLLRKMLDAHAK